jgi:transcriptional regulator with XRE-family HTH domain
MTWEDKLAEKLREIKGNSTVQDFAEHTGISASTLYKIFGGYRGIGADVLEQLRRIYPDEVASVFLPHDWTVVTPDEDYSAKQITDDEADS